MSGASFKGNLEVLNLSDIFQSLAMNRHSGTLIISDGKREKKIYFAEGEIQLLSSSRRMRLGELLIATGKISDDDLDLALKLQKQNRKKLGEILVEEGFCDEEDIARIVKFQIEEEIYDLFLWKKAEFEFIADHIPDDMKRESSNLMRLALNTNSLIMEALRRLDEWELVKQAVPSTKEIFVVSDPAKLEQVELPERLRNEIHLIDGKTNVEGLAEKTMVSEFELCKLLADLVHQGAIRALTMEELVQKAEEGYAVNDFSAAANLYGRLAELAPGEPKVLIPLAESLRRSGDDRQALAIFEELTRRLDPIRDAERLRRCYETIVALDPDRADIVRKLQEMDVRAKAQKKRGVALPVAGGVAGVLLLLGAIFHTQVGKVVAAIFRDPNIEKRAAEEKAAKELLVQMSFAQNDQHDWKVWHELGVRIWKDYPRTTVRESVTLPVVVRTEPPGFSVSVNGLPSGVTSWQDPVVVAPYSPKVDKVVVQIRKPARGATAVSNQPPLQEQTITSPLEWPGEIVFRIEDKPDLQYFGDSPIETELALHAGSKTWLGVGRDGAVYQLVETAQGMKRVADWREAAVGPFGDCFTAPALAGDKAWVGLSVGGVALLDLEKKTVQQGHFPVEAGSVRTRPLVFPSKDRVVFGSTSGTVYGYALAGGRAPRWRAEAEGPILFGIQGDEDGETVVFASGDERLRAYDVTSGKPAWPKPVVVGHAAAPPVRVRDTIYVANEDGELLAVAARTGKLRDLRYREPGGKRFRFAADEGDRLYLATVDGHVRALDLKSPSPDGKSFPLAWAQDFSRATTRAPWIGWAPVLGSGDKAVPDRVFVAFDGARVFALESRTGLLAWQGTLDNDYVTSPFSIQGDAFLVGTPTAVHLFRRQ